jgi:hypothetical protein
VGWFEVAATRDGRQYSVSTFPTGLSPAGWHRENVVQRIPLGTLDYLTPRALVGMMINWLIFRGGWTVVVAPWGGGWTRVWKVRVESEAESERRANALYQMIANYQWDPAEEAPPCGSERSVVRRLRAHGGSEDGQRRHSRRGPRDDN